MNGSRYDCSQVSIDYSDEEFEAVLVEFAKVFNADSCWTELCEGGDEVYMQILFDYAAQCAGVDLDLDSCVKDEIVAILFGGGGIDDGSDDNYGGEVPANHTRVLRSLQEVMTGESDADGFEVSERELQVFFFVTFGLIKLL